MLGEGLLSILAQGEAQNSHSNIFHPLIYQICSLLSSASIKFTANCCLFVISLQDSSFPVGSSYEFGNTYWTPSLKEEEIYLQMSHWNYREIPHNLITLSNPLGEGQFGEVYQAEWEIPQHGHVDVAVKVVKKGAPQEERLKLLQEAAILGQFRHRHVVSLLGVVTLGEPVSGWIACSIIWH